MEIEDVTDTGYTKKDERREVLARRRQLLLMAADKAVNRVQ
jgi:hypothetical protein